MERFFDSIQPDWQRYTKLVVIAAVFGLVPALTGCKNLNLVEDVNPRILPNVEPELVVHSYISPQDTLLVVAVSLSNSAGDKLPSQSQISGLTKATVMLSEGSRSIVLKYDSLRRIYRADPTQFPIMVGQTYQLTLSTPDGKRVTATTTIPDQVPIGTIEFDSVPAQYSNIFNYSLRFNWQDPAQAVNYYHVTGDVDYGTVGRVYTNGGTYTEVPYQAVNPIYFSYDGDSPYLSDEKHKGRVMSSPAGRLFFNYYVNGTPAISPPVNANVYLLNVTEAYYRYHESIRQQTANRDNPFAEPTLIQGNIQGGFGCFGGYNRTIKTLRIK